MCVYVRRLTILEVNLKMLSQGLQMLSVITASVSLQEIGLKMEDLSVSKTHLTT